MLCETPPAPAPPMNHTAPSRRTIARMAHASDAGRWEYSSAEPSPLLRGVVHGRYVGYRELTPQRIRRRELPNDRIPWILNFGPAFAVAQRSTRWQGEVRDTFVAGIDDGYALVDSDGRADCMQVDLTPIGALRVLGVPLGIFAGQTLDPEELMGAEVPLLVERLAEAATWERRFDLLDAYLLQRLERSLRAPNQLVAFAWSEIVRSSGRCRIDELARSMQRSREHLARSFREEVGVSPKAFARIVRFHHVLRWIEQRNGEGWSDIALECGYSDQSHLIHEFRTLAGYTPTEIAGKLVPDAGLLEDTPSV